VQIKFLCKGSFTNHFASKLNGMKKQIWILGLLMSLVGCFKDTPPRTFPNGTGTPIYSPPPYVPPTGPDLSKIYPNGTQVAQLSEARPNMVSAVCNGRFLFAGGDNYGPNIASLVDIYDPQTGQVSMARLSLSRHFMVAVSVGKQAFFAGGYDPVAKMASSRIDIYDGERDIWETAELSMPRFHLAAAVLGDKIYFAGGTTEYPNYSSRVDIYNISDQTWDTAELSEPRTGIVTAVLGSKILFVGGNNANGPSARIDIYDAAIDSWSTSSLSRAYSELTSATFQNRAFFAGRLVGSDISSVEIYDLMSNSWISVQLSEYKGDIPIGHTQNKVVFIGGWVSWQGHSRKIEIYDPATGEWEYLWMTHDLWGQSIISHNGIIYSAGGAFEAGDYAISGIYKLEF
jgi:hypothetical protein